MNKACEMFGIKQVIIPIGSDYCMDMRQTRKAITKNTIGLIGSFPSYPHGTIDDIETLSAMGLEYDIPVHVDCCLGGFLVAFFKDAKIDLPKWDFSLKGICL